MVSCSMNVKQFSADYVRRTVKELNVARGRVQEPSFICIVNHSEE